MGILLSVNVGKPRVNPWKDVGTTAIDKRAVTGPVAVTVPGPKGTGETGLAGDQVRDVKHHGGPDQAVYAYAREDLNFWAGQLGRDLPHGIFGENLTTSDLDISDALVGERWRIGPEVLLEVSVPRLPCGTFQGWMRESGWIKRFTEVARPGTYLRVVEPGNIQTGDQITVVDRPTHDMTVALTFRALTTEPDLLPRLQAVDALSAELKARVDRRTAAKP